MLTTAEPKLTDPESRSAGAGSPEPIPARRGSLDRPHLRAIARAA